MDRDLLSHLPVILAVAKRGGFAAAASELGMSPSAISHSVRLVEERLGLPLFARTTRSVALTEAGAALIGSAGPALRDIQEQIEQIRAAKDKITGLLRLNVPNIALPIIITPALRKMAGQFPDLRVEIFVDDAISDIVASGFDAGIRLGEMIAEDMIAVRLTPPFQAGIVAAPSYIARHGAPKTVSELRDHNCIAFRQIKSGGLYKWELSGKSGELTVESGGSMIVNNPLYARKLALEGIGLAYLFAPLIKDDIKAGRLVQILAETAITEPGLFLYFPKRAANAPKLRAFIEIARQIRAAM